MPDKPRLCPGTKQANPGIVHFGPGAFFRAFNAVYTEEAMQHSGGDWGIIAVSLKSPTAKDQLAPQKGAFTSVTLDQDSTMDRVISSIVDVKVAPEDPQEILNILADPKIKILSLTITEKGYCHEPATGQLMRDHPDIEHDLRHPNAPRSAPGFILHALAERRRRGLRPFTVLSSDNIPSNGQLARRIICEMAQMLDPDLAEWIGQYGRFPSTMVDRITPATTEADVAQLAERKGYQDPAMVQHEPFRQWVIEDQFVDKNHPDWCTPGAQFVHNVDAHEMMKLRCLNGSHSSLAYLGYLAGFDTIFETISHPAFSTFCTKLWHKEVIPTLRQPEGENLAEYCEKLLARYRNAAVRHRTWQIAMDGSQKLPQRILGTMADNIKNNGSISMLSLAVAGWMFYVGGKTETGAVIEVKDPLSDALRCASDAADAPAEKVQNLLAFDSVFDPDLSRNPRFIEAVTSAYLSLCEKGALATVQEYAT